MKQWLTAVEFFRNPKASHEGEDELITTLPSMKKKVKKND